MHYIEYVDLHIENTGRISNVFGLVSLQPIWPTTFQHFVEQCIDLYLEIALHF